MFVIVHNNFVIKGPNEWNKKRFEEVIREECEVEYTLDYNNNDRLPITVAENVKILPVLDMPLPEYNPKTQHLNGPYWNFTETHAEQSWVAEDLPVYHVAGQFKERVTAHRYTKETRGIKLTIQGVEVTVDTARGSRDIFLQAYLMLADDATLNWKFPETWLTLTKAELGSIVASGRDHIQSCFDWEMNYLTRADAATSLSELNSLYVEFENETTPQSNTLGQPGYDIN